MRPGVPSRGRTPCRLSAKQLICVQMAAGDAAESAPRTEDRLSPGSYDVVISNVKLPDNSSDEVVGYRRKVGDPCSGAGAVNELPEGSINKSEIVCAPVGSSRDASYR